MGWGMRAIAMFVAKSRHYMIFGFYPGMMEFSNWGTDCPLYSMHACVYDGGLYTRVSGATHAWDRSRYAAW